ncbi:unnamed protein product [Callosobruchus maculatus]|uniref:Uncharacterized protein n=1 Tax=Callosobruchus maculatus TaxID=64391 RepID=A0A653CHC9_CALMS|nr:unnamed protein product [Callosobruchus maculatus]
MIWKQVAKNSHGCSGGVCRGLILLEPQMFDIHTSSLQFRYEKGMKKVFTI